MTPTDASSSLRLGDPEAKINGLAVGLLATGVVGDKARVLAAVCDARGVRVAIRVRAALVIVL